MLLKNYGGEKMIRIGNEEMIKKEGVNLWMKK